MASMIEEIAKFILRLFIQFIPAWTGEIILSVMSIGKHKPRWNLYAKESPIRFVLFSESSFWIDAAFGVVTIAVLYAALAKG